MWNYNTGVKQNNNVPDASMRTFYLFIIQPFCRRKVQVTCQRLKVQSGQARRVLNHMNLCWLTPPFFEDRHWTGNIQINWAEIDNDLKLYRYSVYRVNDDIKLDIIQLKIFHGIKMEFVSCGKTLWKMHKHPTPHPNIYGLHRVLVLPVLYLRLCWDDAIRTAWFFLHQTAMSID